MGSKDGFSGKELAKAALATVLLLFVGALGVWSAVSGIQEGRLDRLAMAFGPLLLAGIGLRPLLGIWRVWLVAGRSGEEAGRSGPSGRDR